MPGRWQIGESRTLGILVSDLENPFFFDIYDKLESAAHSRGYEVVVANTDYRSKQLRARIVSCVEGRRSIRMREVKVQIGTPE